MKIFVDADSCPRPARELIVRVSARRGIRAVFAANRPIPGLSGGAVMEICSPAADSADDRIVELARPGDLAVTRDIPLALRLVEAAILVMDDRGQVYTAENIRERLSIRNFMVGLAENGLRGERTAVYGAREQKALADSLDRVLTRLLRENSGL
jgi:uncharacterized protein YaiI (UPF0178 family)